MSKRSFGFSIVELLIAVSILSVLTAIGATVYKGSSDNSQDQVRLRDFSAIKQGLELYRHSERSYPKELKDLVKYLDPIPADPEASSGKQYAYSTVPASCTSAKRNCKAYVVCAKKKGDKQMDVPGGCKNLSCAGTSGDCDMGITSDEPYDPVPTPAVVPTFYRVFVTSTQYNGNLGGLAGADAKCQARADAADLNGTWKAWLSNSVTSASSRLDHSIVPYKLLNDVSIATNWDDLTDGSLLTPINRTELNTEVGYSTVFTYTNIDGNSSTLPAGTCLNWTSSNSSTDGRGGIATENYNLWTSSTTAYSSTSCGASAARLYCFEQP